MADLPVPVEQVKVLRLGPDDRLVVEADSEPTSREEWSYIREEIAGWAGIHPGRVLILAGAKLRTLATGKHKRVPVREGDDG